MGNLEKLIETIFLERYNDKLDSRDIFSVTKGITYVYSDYSRHLKNKGYLMEEPILSKFAFEELTKIFYYDGSYRDPNDIFDEEITPNLIYKLHQSGRYFQEHDFSVSSILTNEILINFLLNLNDDVLKITYDKNKKDIHGIKKLLFHANLSLEKSKHARIKMRPESSVNYYSSSIDLYEKCIEQEENLFRSDKSCDVKFNGRIGYNYMCRGEFF
ncbi:hypothetical protein ACFL1H_07810, partial [Nanoarchaeota archaeon]